MLIQLVGTKLNDKIAILFLPRKTTDTKYILSAITMKYTDDKIIDKLPILGTFSKRWFYRCLQINYKIKGNFKVESRKFSIDSLIDFSVKTTENSNNIRKKKVK